MKIKMTFNSFEELNEWLDSTCTRCAMCNLERRNPCKDCKAWKQYKSISKTDFNKEVNDED